MAVVSLNTSIASMRAQRRLSETSARLRTTFTQLSSGLRINRASDDAAGLAISSGLANDRRVALQGIRNVNDAISVLSITEGALAELSAIAIRQGELAEQAANGVYSTGQRKALDAEANQLVDEWNRIVDTVSFNGQELLGGEFNLHVQSGYGTDGGLDLIYGDRFQRNVGDGTFKSALSYNGSGNVDVTVGDFNRDGFVDFVAAPGNGLTALSVSLGRGDGTFNTRVTYQAGVSESSGEYATVLVSDYNHDGMLDLSVTDGGDNRVSVLLGNGDGSFRGSNKFCRDKYAASHGRRGFQ